MKALSLNWNLVGGPLSKFPAMVRHPPSGFADGRVNPDASHDGGEIDANRDKEQKSIYERQAVVRFSCIVSLSCLGVPPVLGLSGTPAPLAAR